MTTATRPSKLLYEVRNGTWIVGSGNDRDEAEAVRDGHATRNGNDPLSDSYVITPEIRKEEE